MSKAMSVIDGSDFLVFLDALLVPACLISAAGVGTEVNGRWSASISNQKFSFADGEWADQGIILKTIATEASKRTVKSPLRMPLALQDGTSAMATVICRDDGCLISLELSNLVVPEREAATAKGQDNAEILDLEREHAWSVLETAIDTLSDGFVIYDSEDRLFMANRSYREMYRYVAPALRDGSKFEEIIRLGVAQGAYADAIGREQEFIDERLSAHLMPIAQREHRLSDGRVIRILEQRTSNGGAVGLHVDVTDMIRDRDEARAASQAKSAFMATLSHEIRNPLTAILGAADILAMRNMTERDKELARSILGSGQTLLSILNDQLDLTKIEAGHMTLDPKPFNLVDLLRPIQVLYSRQASSKGITFETDIAEDVERTLSGDEHRIAQILYNVIGNSMKFTHAGGVKLRVSKEGRDTVFVVSDSGIGMDAEMQERLFLPFSQAQQSTAQQFGGTGLGMSISSKLANIMGGDISVSSEVGAGSTLSIRLPLTMGDVATLPPSVYRKVAPMLSGRKVLVAEDNDINRTILEIMFRNVDADVTSVRNGLEALDAAAVTKFDLICLDISMPELDGLETLYMLEKKASHDGISLSPIVAITAYASPEDTERFLKAGFSAHITKPFEKRTIMEILSRLLGEGRLGSV